MIRGAS